MSTVATPASTMPSPILRYGSLILLVFQNCSAVILMRYTQSPDRERFSVPIANLYIEATKLVICALALLFYEHSFSATGLRPLWNILFRKECLQMAVPALLYAVQNNVLFVALANLDPTVFAVLYQLKLIFTVVLMMIMLGREISRYKWMTLIMLFVGIVLTQIKKTSSSSSGSKNNKKHDGEDESLFLGLFAVNVCALSSAFASVYFEKVLKGTSAAPVAQTPKVKIVYDDELAQQQQQQPDKSEAALLVDDSSSKQNNLIDKNNTNTPGTISSSAELSISMTSLSVRNIQLSVFGFALNALVYFFENARASQNVIDVSSSSSLLDQQNPSFISFFIPTGFDAWVFALIVVQAAGGILVATVIKFADNILKGFATAIAIIVNGAVSYYLFSFEPTGLFLVGAVIVMVSTVLYSL